MTWTWSIRWVSSPIRAHAPSQHSASPGCRGPGPKAPFADRTTRRHRQQGTQSFLALVAMLQRRSRLGHDAAAPNRIASQVSLCRPGGLIPQLPTDPVQNAAADELEHRPQTPEAVAVHRLPLGAL